MVRETGAGKQVDQRCACSSGPAVCLIIQRGVSQVHEVCMKSSEAAGAGGGAQRARHAPLSAGAGAISSRPKGQVWKGSVVQRQSSSKRSARGLVWAKKQRAQRLEQKQPERGRSLILPHPSLVGGVVGVQRAPHRRVALEPAAKGDLPHALAPPHAAAAALDVSQHVPASGASAMATAHRCLSTKFPNCRKNWI